MLGIAISKSSDSRGDHNFVFVYYTESKNKDGSDLTEGLKGKPGYCRPADLCKDLVGDRIVRYELTNNNNLINPKILLKNSSKPVQHIMEAS